MHSDGEQATPGYKITVYTVFDLGISFGMHASGDPLPNATHAKRIEPLFTLCTVAACSKTRRNQSFFLAGFTEKAATVIQQCNGSGMKMFLRA